MNPFYIALFVLVWITMAVITNVAVMIRIYGDTPQYVESPDFMLLSFVCFAVWPIALVCLVLSLFSEAYLHFVIDIIDWLTKGK